MARPKNSPKHRVFRTASGRRSNRPAKGTTTGVEIKEKADGSTDVAVVTIDTQSNPNHPRTGQPGKGSMSVEEYDKMVNAFRDIGPNMSAVSRVCGLDRRTVARAWNNGVRAHGGAPIIGIIESEKLEARAEVAQRWAESASQDAKMVGMDSAKHAESRKNMSDDAIRGRTEEANMVRLARGDATQCLAAVARLLPGLNKWAKHAAEHLNTNNPKSIADTVKLMGDVSKVVERTANAANTIMAMERRLLGQPEAIVGVQMHDISMEEAMVHVNAMDRTMARARALGLLPAAENVIDADFVENEDILAENEGDSDALSTAIADT